MVFSILLNCLIVIPSALKSVVIYTENLFEEGAEKIGCTSIDDSSSGQILKGIID